MTTRLELDAENIFRAAVQSSQANQALRNLSATDLAGSTLESHENVFVLAAGKAAMAMAGAVEACFSDRIAGGLAVVPYGYRNTLPDGQQAPQTIDVIEAGHPVPDASSVAAAARALEIATGCGTEDLLLVLLSGGASALWSAPAGQLTQAELARVNAALLKSGADIHQINTVRKHLSRIKGGRLASAAWPAYTITLAVSDVTGDDLSVIGSGPTTGDPTTWADAIAVVHERELVIPLSVQQHLERGLRGEVSDTCFPGDDRLARAQSLLVGSNRSAVQAAVEAARAMGYKVVRVDFDVQGEARTIGNERAHEALGLEPGQCTVWGGETTVIVRGKGRGGRNQEVALAAACAMDGSGEDVLLLSAGTDGIDGPTDAAGAWATPCTAARARALGMDPEIALRHNDAYTLFAGVEQLLVTGPTHTNVMDIGLIIRAKG